MSFYCRCGLRGSLNEFLVPDIFSPLCVLGDWRMPSDDFSVNDVKALVGESPGVFSFRVSAFLLLSQTECVTDPLSRQEDNLLPKSVVYLDAWGEIPRRSSKLIATLFCCLRCTAHDRRDWRVVATRFWHEHADIHQVLLARASKARKTAQCDQLGVQSDKTRTTSGISQPGMSVERILASFGRQCVHVCFHDSC